MTRAGLMVHSFGMPLFWGIPETHMLQGNTLWELPRDRGLYPKPSFFERSSMAEITPVMYILPKRFLNRVRLIECALVDQCESKTAEVDTYWEKYSAPIKNDSNEIINSIYLTISISKIKKLEKELKEVEKQLGSKRRKLEEVSSALTVLFKKRDKDKRVLQKNIWFNVKEQLFPTLERLKKTNLTY
jgi:hypothetical protein